MIHSEDNIFGEPPGQLDVIGPGSEGRKTLKRENLFFEKPKKVILPVIVNEYQRNQRNQNQTENILEKIF